MIFCKHKNGEVICWHWTQCPDLRFGQLVENVFAKIRDKGKDPFYFEEDEMLGYFRKYFKENGYIKC